MADVKTIIMNAKVKSESADNKNAATDCFSAFCGQALKI